MTEGSLAKKRAQYSIFDNVSTVFCFAVISLPSFFLAMILRFVFSVKLGIFPLDGMETAGVAYTGMQHVGDVIMHMVLPVVCLTLLSVGSTTRYVRTSMLEVIRQDYVRTARAKGLPERVVIYKHALKNGMIPIVTFVGGALPSLFCGSHDHRDNFLPGRASARYSRLYRAARLSLMMGFTMSWPFWLWWATCFLIFSMVLWIPESG